MIITAFFLTVFDRLTDRYFCEGAFLVSAFSLAVEHLIWTIGDRNIAPKQAIALDKNTNLA